MKAAIVRWKSGKAAKLPIGFLVHTVAVRYGQSPAQVRDWPADDFLMATSFYPYTNE